MEMVCVCVSASQSIHSVYNPVWVVFISSLFQFVWSCILATLLSMKWLTTCVTPRTWAEPLGWDENTVTEAFCGAEYENRLQCITVYILLACNIVDFGVSYTMPKHNLSACMSLWMCFFFLSGYWGSCCVSDQLGLKSAGSTFQVQMGSRVSWTICNQWLGV